MSSMFASPDPVIITVSAAPAPMDVSAGAGSAATSSAQAPTSPPPRWQPTTDLDKFDTIIFDCDGVLWQENTVIPGAPATLKQLLALGKRLLFATNNSGKSREAYAEKFTKLGFPDQMANPDTIFTSSQATAFYLSKIAAAGQFDKENQIVYIIGQNGIGIELAKEGIKFIEGSKMFDQKHLTKAELAELVTDPKIGAVVVGIDDQLTYTKMAYGLACLNRRRGGDGSDALDKSCLFISTNQDASLPTAGHTLPGAGSCVAMMAVAAGRTATNIGKPETAMLSLAVEKYQLDRSRILMIGDRLDTDILFGINGGVSTLLICDTGVHTVADITPACTPSFVLGDVSQLLPATQTSA